MSGLAVVADDVDGADQRTACAWPRCDREAEVAVNVALTCDVDLVCCHHLGELLVDACYPGGDPLRVVMTPLRDGG